MCILSFLARYAYRRPEPDSELSILYIDCPVNKQDIKTTNEANAFIVSTNQYRSCDDNFVSVEKQNCEK